MKRKHEAVLFDWDLTLGSGLGDTTFEERLSTLFAKDGIDSEPQEIAEVISVRTRLILDGKLSGAVDPQTKNDLITFYQQVLALLSGELPTREFADHLRKSYATLPFVLYDDTLPTLRSLTEQGILLGIVTNNSMRVQSQIQELVGQYVPMKCVTISDDVGVYKPDKRIFEIGAGRVGIAPSACIYVGDNLITDAIAAKQLGNYGKGLWLNSLGKVAQVDLPRGVAEISSIHEVLHEIG